MSLKQSWVLSKTVLGKWHVPAGTQDVGTPPTVRKEVEKLWPQVSLHTRQDFWSSAEDRRMALEVKANIRVSRSGCGIDQARSRRNLPSRYDQGSEDAHCSIAVTGEMRPNGNDQQWAMTEKSTSTSSTEWWRSPPTDPELWVEPCGLSTPHTTVPWKGWVRTHCSSPRAGCDDPKFQGEAGAAGHLSKLKGRSPPVTILQAIKPQELTCICLLIMTI